MNISEHFTLQEFITSNTARYLQIDNTPPPQVIENITFLVNNLLQPLRTEWDDIITITSGYRCKQLNDAVLGSKTSKHLKGLAADICPKKGRMKDFQQFVIEFLKTHDYDECIFEKPRLHVPQWIHLSISPTKNRRKTFTLL